MHYRQFERVWGGREEAKRKAQKYNCRKELLVQKEGGGEWRCRED